MYAHIVCTDTVIKPPLKIVFHMCLSLFLYIEVYKPFRGFFSVNIFSGFCFSVWVDGLKSTVLTPLHFFLYTPQKYAIVI